MTDLMDFSAPRPAHRPKRPPVPRCPAAAVLWLFAVVAWLPLSAQVALPKITEVVEVVPGEWRVGWEIPDDIECQVERSFDLEEWTPVGEVFTSATQPAWLIDTGVGDEPQCFWRIDADGGGTSAVVAMFRIIRLQRLDESGEPASPEAGGRWQVTWTSEAGREYRLERSPDLTPDSWEEVATVTATGPETTVTDEAAGDFPKNFWRVVLLDGSGEPFVVSDPSTGSQLGGATSAALFQIVASSPGAIESIVFFDDGIPLGNAQPGLGDVWTFTVAPGEGPPQTRAINAEVTTADGGVVTTPVRRFLLADPTKFVPLGAGGLPEAGGFVGIDDAGQLAAFAYFPEGVGSAERGTGVHFVFSAGATLETGVDSALPLNFSAGVFHRGAGDPEPVQVSGGLRTLDLEAIEPVGVASAFGLPAEGIELCWGSGCIAWQGGALGEAGWEELQIDLGIGDFLLPGSRLDATVTFDPVSGEPRLVVCYFGSWSPVPDAEFTIPEADPLKIYLSRDGGVSAHGTAEASFPNGAKVRGSLSWRRPNFEFRFEGRGIVIPALDGLRGSLEDPTADVPAGTTAAELDIYAERLAGHLKTSRGLALASAGQATPGGGATSPLPAPSDAAGAALEAWAGRIITEASKQAPQILPAGQVEELTAVLRQAAKTAAGAHDLGTSLKLLRDFSLIRGGAGTVLPSDPELLETLDGLEERLISAAERIVADQPEFELSPEFAEVVGVLNELVDPTPSAPEPGGLVSAKGPAVDSQQLELRIRRLFSTYSGKVTRLDPLLSERTALLASMTPREVLFFLDRLRLARVLELRKPQPSSEQLGRIQAAVSDAIDAFISKQNVIAGPARAAGDYDRLFAVLRDRSQVLPLLDQLGAAIVADDSRFAPGTAEVLAEFLRVRALRPSGAVLVDAPVFAAVVDGLARFATGTVLIGEIEKALAVVEASFSLRSNRCGRLAEELGRANLAPPRLPGWHVDQFSDVSGRYESIDPSVAAVFRNLRINQGGRYLSGSLIEHALPRPDRAAGIKRFLLDGLLAGTGSEDGNPFLKFSIRLVLEGAEGDARLPIFGMLTITETSGGMTARLAVGGQTDVSFGRVQAIPAFSELIIASFDPEFQDAIGSVHKFPLHSRIIGEVGLLSEELKDAIGKYNFAPAGTLATQHVATADAVVGNILALGTEAQQPQFRDIVSNLLANEDFEANRAKIIGPGQTGTITRDFWVALNTMFLFEGEGRQNLAALIGQTSEEYRSAETFTYEFTIKQRAASAMFVGGAILEIDIVKKYPASLGLPDENMALDGNVLGYSRGLGAGLSTGETEVTVTSPFNYTANNFRGPLELNQISAAFSLSGVGLSYTKGNFVFSGDGTFPPIYVPASGWGLVEGLVVSAGMDIWVGICVERGSEQVLIGNQIQFDAEGDPDFPEAVFFEVNGSTLTPCGEEVLQRFIAEHRALIVSPTTSIEIEGFTDRTGSESFNLQLSQQRAESVKQALIGFLGPGLKIPASQIVTISRGEAQAAADGVPDAPDPLADNPDYRRADIRVSGVVTATIKAQ